MVKTNVIALTLASCFSQGGAVVEIFSGQGKDPVARWKLCGGPSAIHKVSFQSCWFPLAYSYGD